MTELVLRNVAAVEFPNKVLIRESNKLVLVPGHRYCLVGPSGCGKTCLMRKIHQRLLDDNEDDNDGVGQWRVSMVEQTVVFMDSAAALSVLDYAVSCTIPADADHPERDAKRRTDRATQLLRDIGLLSLCTTTTTTSTDQTTEKPVSALSQGWKQRLALVCAVLSDPDVLLVDEPNEGVDLDGLIHMERFLVKHVHEDAIVLVISHDVDFLCNVSTDVIYLDEDEDGSGARILRQFAGDYGSYMRREQERLAALESRVDGAQRRRAQATKFIQKHSTDASKQKQVKEKKDKLDRAGFFRDDGRRYKTHSLQKLDEKYLRLPQQTPHELRQAKPLQFKHMSLEDDGGGGSAAGVLLSLENADIGYVAAASSLPVLRNVSVYISAQSRVALVGGNSSGKSTLMHALLGDKLGEIVVRSPRGLTAAAAGVAFVPQREGERLAEEHGDLTPAELLLLPLHQHQAMMMMKNEYEARQYLGGFGLSGPPAVTKIRHLSVGQRTRLAIAIGCRTGPRLLVLDEPTHGLDLAARNALVAWIQAFPGALLVSSHDRHFLRNAANRFNELWVVRGQQVHRRRCAIQDNCEEDDDNGFCDLLDDYLASSLL